MSAPGRPLAGWHVLVPRGGDWGDRATAILRERGAVPIVAPLLNFASTGTPSALANALFELQDGQFDWLVVTSATTVDVLLSMGTRVHPSTRIAAVGETTASALSLSGYRVDFVPQGDNSARGLVKEWPASEIHGRVLIPHSESPEPTLVAGLELLGFDVEFVSAYRTVGIPVTPAVAGAVASGEVRAVLVTSGSVARQISLQLGPLPPSVVVVAIGPRTAFDARAAGLTVHVIAEERTIESLVDGLVEFAGTIEP